MSEQTEEEYAAQIKAIFADQAMVSAMRQRFPNQGEPADPAMRDRRWDNAVEVFGRKDADWWSPRKNDGK